MTDALIAAAMMSIIICVILAIFAVCGGCRKFVLTLITFAIAGCLSGCHSGSSIVVDPSETPLRSGYFNGFTYNVYNNYIGIASYSGYADVALEIPGTIEELPVAKLEDGFLPDGDYRFGRLILPDSLVHIGEYSLVSKSGWLTKINIPESLSYIGAGSLDGVDLGDSEFVIVGDGILMRYNGDGGDVKLPSGIRVIGNAFYENKNVLSLRVDRGCEIIVPSAFAFSEISDIWLPDSVKSIGSDCFRGGSLQSIRLPSGECEIGKNAFETESASGLVLTIPEKSDALLYAVENDLSFTFEKGDGKLYSSEYLDAVGEGTHEFSYGKQKLTLEVKKELITADHSSAVVQLDESSDGMTDRLLLVNLRTLRVTDEVDLGRDSLMAAIDRTSEPRDYSDCEINGKLGFSRKDGGNFIFSGDFSVKHESDEWQITAEFVYTPGSGYISAEQITTNALVPNYLDGFSELCATADNSARLYGRPDGDSFEGKLMIRWTFGAITLDSEKFVKTSEPRLTLSDMNGDGVTDLILIWYPDRTRSARQSAEIFFGPTGAKKSMIDPEDELSGENGVRFEIFGDYLIGFVNDEEASRLVYRYEDGRMKLSEKFVPTSEATGDEKSKVIQIGKEKYLIVTNDNQYEFDSDDEITGFRLIYDDQDGDGTDDLIVVTSNDATDLEAYIVTSRDKKLYKTDIMSDLSKNFSSQRLGDGWLIESRFGSFRVGSPTDGDPSELPDLMKKRSIQTIGKKLTCDISILIGTNEEADIYSETTLRLTYGLDTILRLKSAEPRNAGVSDRVMTYEEFREYLRGKHISGGQENFILTDRGNAIVGVDFSGSEPKLMLVMAKEQTLSFDQPIPAGSDFTIYEAGGYLVVGSYSNGFGDTYIITEDSIIRNFTSSAQKTDDYLSFSEKDGRLAYTKRSMKYSESALKRGFYAILDGITSRDEFFAEEGFAEVIDSELILTPERTLTLSDAYELDAEFRKYHDYVASYKTLDEVIERNLRMLSGGTEVTVVSMTLSEFMKEVGEIMRGSDEKQLSATLTDIDNAVLLVTKGKYGTILSNIEARGNLLVPKNDIVFDNLTEFTLKVSGSITLLQVVNEDGSCDRYVFYADGIYEEHDTTDDAKVYRTRFDIDSSGRLVYEKSTVGGIADILRKLETRDDTYSESGYIDVQKGINKIAESAVKLSEKYDLDAEYEKQKSELGGYATLDEMLAYRFAESSGYEMVEITENGDTTARDLIEAVGSKGSCAIIVKSGKFTSAVLVKRDQTDIRVTGILSLGRKVIFDEPYTITGQREFVLFESGVNVMVQFSEGTRDSGDGFIGIKRQDVYIFSGGGVTVEKFDVSAGNAPDRVTFYNAIHDGEGNRIEGMFGYYTVPWRLTGDCVSILSSLTSRKEVFSTGQAGIRDGKVEILTRETIDADAVLGFDSMFEKHREYFPGYATLDELIRANAARLSGRS